MSNRAWVTLATNDSYGLGALVLAHSLRRVGSAYPAVVLITPSVTDAMRDRLSAVFAEVVMVDVLDSGDAAHLALLQRPELGITFTKIHCWNLTQYEKCVFLDADTLMVQNCDELFEREELSAAPDVGWPDCFNSGVFVYKPSAETFAALIEFAQQRGSFDGGDQGLLNSYFSDWAHGDIKKHLPFLYNVTSAAFYSYLPALKHYGRDLKIIHFIGAAKPWLQQFDWRSRQVQAPEHLHEFLQLWWDVFVGQVHSQLDPTMVEVEDAPTTIEPEQEAYVYTNSTTDYIHYKPVLDPDSEFHWHRPDTQLNQSEATPPEIDLAQFHDPWDIYKGHIHPLAEEAKSASYTQSYYQENQQEIRRHVWEAPHVEQQDPYHSEIQHIDTQFNRVTHHEQNSQYSHSDATQFHNDNYYNSNQENHRYTQQNMEPFEYNKETQPSFNYSHHQQPNSTQDEHNFNHSLDQRNSWTEDQQYDNTSQHSHGFHSHFHHLESQQFQKAASLHESQQFHESGYNNQQEYAHTDNKCKEHNTNNANKINASITNHSNQHSHTNETYDTLDRDHTFSNYAQTDITQFTHSLRNRVEYVYCLHLDHDRGRFRRKRNIDKLLPISENANGDTEWEVNGHEEFIIPRHPYDGFYLRHKTTIDARGRKICTHEIPPTPSPSISPPESPIFFDAVSEFVLQEDACSEHDDNSGVAGNLARVTPDAIVAQSEAIDELTRRQGWEAGNIDYMGADSFANIWAKISQTLSQPPTSPPNQTTPPPEEPAPAKFIEESIPAQVSEEPKKPEESVATKEPEQPKAVAVEVEQPDATSIAKEAPAVSAAAADPIPSETDASSPSESAAPSVEPIVEVVTPKESVPAAEPGIQDAPVVAPTEATVPKEAIPIAEVIPQPASSVKASLPVESADIPAELSAPVEIPVPVVEAVLAEAAAPESAAPITTEEIPAPVLEASAAVESPTAPEPAAAPGETKPVKAAKDEPPKQDIPASAETDPTVAAEAPPSAVESVQPVEAPTKPEDTPVAPATDSPPLANTPSTEEVPTEPAAKSEERRRPAGKLQLSPPLAADPLPTPDSELEDAASLAQSIIASELRTPTVTAPSPPHPASPAQLQQEKRLSVEGPQIPTPPVGSVSLGQIGVKPAKGKATIAAQIESSVADKPAPAEPKADAPKKKVVKKVLKKETSGEAPVPPPRKKEKKPKEK